MKGYRVPGIYLIHFLKKNRSTEVPSRQHHHINMDSLFGPLRTWARNGTFVVRDQQ